MRSSTIDANAPLELSEIASGRSSAHSSGRDSNSSGASPRWKRFPSIKKAVMVRRQRTDFKVKAAYMTGGATCAQALISRSTQGKALEGMESCMRIMDSKEGSTNAKTIKVISQKCSICVAVGRVTADTMNETLGDTPLKACSAFLATMARVQSAKEQRAMYAAFLEEKSAPLSHQSSNRSSDTPSVSPRAAMTSAPPTLSNANTPSALALKMKEAPADPKDPQHAALVRSIKAMGEALVVLLAPHLSEKTIKSLEALTEFWCVPSHLDAFFTSDAISVERSLVLEEMEQVVAQAAVD